MCMYITVKIEDKDRRYADFPKSLQVEDGLIIQRMSRSWREKDLTLSISEDGCACSMLADDADWNSETWSMIPSALPRLAKTLGKIHELFPEGFFLEAMWGGEKATGEIEVTSEELQDTVISGKLGNKVRYRVR